MIVSNEVIVYLQRDFGAKGNGIDDDTTAVHNFFNYLTMNGGIGIVEPGEYKSSSFTFKSNSKPFSIAGIGANECGFKNLSKGTFLTFVKCSGVHLTGISVDCQYTITRAKMHGIALSSCTDFIIDNCYVYDFLGSGIIAYASNDETCNGILVKDCFVQATEAFKDWQNEPSETKKTKECNGVVLADCDYSIISGCRAVDISLFGIELKNHSKWNQVINCSAKNSRYGFGMGQQTTDDTGCERNIINGFLAENCYMGGILGKAKLNNISGFTVDFSGSSSVAQNAFRFQLKSAFNSLSNLVVSGMPKGKGIVRYESGANNNVTQITVCQQLSEDYNLIVAEYNGKAEKTEGNYTTLIRSNATIKNKITGRYNLSIQGDATEDNKTWYDWDKSEITS